MIYIFYTENNLKPGVYLIVTIAMIAEKSVSGHSDRMDTSPLTIPTIAGIESGSIPAIASVIVTILNDPNDHIDTDQRS